MESTSKSFLRLEPTSKHEIRKEFDLHHPGVMDGMIENFENWIKQQKHFTKKDFDRNFLETTIISAKGSLERAKRTLDKICTAKTLKPEYFQESNAKNLMDIPSFMIPVMLPKQTPDHYRVYFVRGETSEFNPAHMKDYYKFVIMLMEYMKRYDSFLGVYCIIDGRDLNVLNIMMTMGILELKNVVTLIVEAYGFRVKGIHLLINSKSVEIALSAAKQVVSAKLASRIHVHKTVEDLYEYFPKDILPEEYGGPEKSLRSLHYELIDALGTEENVEYFEDMLKPGTDETLRPAASYNENVLGMAGSFRNLRVD